MSRPDYKGDGRGTALGLAVADEDSGLTVLSMIRDGLWSVPVVKGQRAFHIGRDLAQAVALVQDAIGELHDVRVALIDDLAIGQGVTARLLALQSNGTIPRYYVRSHHSPLLPLPRTIPIESCNLDSRAWSEQRFADRRDELWWNAREAIRQGELTLPSPEEISHWGLPIGHDPIAQLSSPLYGSDGSGHIVVWDERGLRGAVERTRHLPAKRPLLAHSVILAWCGYLSLKGQRPYQPAHTTQELFNLRTRELLERGQRWNRTRSGPGRTPLVPWLRMAR